MNEKYYHDVKEWKMSTSEEKKEWKILPRGKMNEKYY